MLLPTKIVQPAEPSARLISSRNSTVVAGSISSPPSEQGGIIRKSPARFGSIHEVGRHRPEAVSLQSAAGEAGRLSTITERLPLGAGEGATWRLSGSG